MAEQGHRGNPAWRKGGPSPNPQGRSKAAIEVASWARRLCETRGRSALQALAESEDKRISLEAWKVLLDRAYGKPAQQVQHTGPEGGVMRIEVVYVSKVNGHE
jgi:hypothetical protein